MTFESGTVTGSKQLWTALDGYIQATTGWSVHATLDTYDKVYISVGTSTAEKIYVRMIADIEDDHRIGHTLTQASTLAGTNGVAFRTYKYFDPSTMDGYNEAGIFGPIGFYHRGNVNIYKGDFHASFTDEIGDGLWTYMQNTTYDPSDNRGGLVFDGKKTVYIPTSGSTGFTKIDIVENVETTLTSAPTTFGQRGCWAVNSTTGAEGLYFGSDTNGGGVRFMRYNIASNNWTYLSDPGAWRSRYSGNCWDGKDTIYLFRGESQSSWAYYDIPTDTWTPGTSTGISTLNYMNPVFVPAGTENGLANDRLYLYRGISTTTFYYLDLDNNGIPSGTWNSRASIPFGMPATSQTWYTGGDTIFAMAPSYQMARYSISANTWTNLNVYSLPVSSIAGASMAYNAHQTHIPADDEGSSTDFWFFGSEDRISVVTKDVGGEYDFLYAGLVSSYYPRSFATTTAAVTAGASKSVTVTGAGNLSAQQKVSISDLSNGSGSVDVHTGYDAKVRNYLSGELTTVESVVGSTVTLVNLEHDYPIGARIGVDLQPVGVTGYRNNRIHMSDHLPAGIRPIQNSSKGQVPQLYRWACTSNTELTGQSAEEARSGQYMLWPIAIVDNDWDHAGQEVRGQFSGVFVVDDNGTATTEDLITFLGNNYLLFQFDSGFYNEGRLLAFGPV